MGQRQAAVADTIAGWVNLKMFWRSFQTAILGGGSEQGLYYRCLIDGGDAVRLIPNPANLGSRLECCCWEMPIFAAMKTHGAITNPQVNEVYKQLSAGHFKKIRPLSDTATRKKYYGTWGSGFWRVMPAKGDLVYFISGDGTETAHVAIATGVLRNGESEVYNFWPATGERGPVAADIELTTVTALEASLLRVFKTKCSIYSTSPIW